MDRRRERKVAATFLFALIVGVVGGWVLSRSSDDVDANLTNPGVVQDPTIGTNVDSTGEVFEFVEMKKLSGGSSTPTLDGTPTVVNFWFSTCQPCRREMPVLAAAATKYEGKVRFIGIDPNDTEESASSFLDKYGITYDIWLDDMGDQVAAAKVGNMPTTFFLDKSGRVVSMHAGELTAADLDNAIAGLGVTG